VVRGSLVSLLQGEEPAPDPEPGEDQSEPDVTPMGEAVRRMIGLSGAD